MANVTDDEDPVIDQDELANYISKKLSIGSETVSMVLDAEMAFLESKGLVLEGNASGEDSLSDAPMGEIDADELAEFIASRTGVGEELVDEILDTEIEYLEKQGAAGTQDLEEV